MPPGKLPRAGKPLLSPRTAVPANKSSQPDPVRFVHHPHRDLYLTNAEGKRHFPKATLGFERALAESGFSFQRARFRTRTGGLYAELISVLPADAARSSPHLLPQPEDARAERIEVGEIERPGSR